MKINRLMVITGGTGGHIFPGVVISKYLKKNGCKIKWLGSYDRLESLIVPKYNIDIDFVSIPNFLKFNFLNIFKNIYFFIKSIFLLYFKIKKWKPDLVLGFGGYISFCGIFSSWLCRIPTMIHEQNSVVGLSNKYLYYISNKVVQAFPNTFSSNLVKTVGNPIRDEILSIPNPKKRFLFRNGPINILILGGSQGSYIINKVIFNLVKKLCYGNFIFLHQVGFLNYKNIIGNIKNKYYHVVNFIEKIDEAYYWADIVISRSGALTVSEVSTIGLPAIFIPYVHKDKHQYFNAKFLVDIGSAFIIDENNLNVDTLLSIILNLNRKKLFKMANISYLNSIKNSNKKFINEIYNF